MKKLVITLLLIVAAFFSFSQTSPTYENITIRDQAKVMGKIYFIPTVSAPAVPLEGMVYADTDGYLYYYNGSVWDTLNATSGGGTGTNYWTQTGNDIINNNTGKTTIDSSLYIPRPYVDSKVGYVLGWLPATGNVYPVLMANLRDTLARDAAAAPSLLDTWVKRTNKVELATATDTVKIASNLRLLPTTAGVGIIYRGASPWLHDFGTNNIWLGKAGNFTQSGSGGNIGIGYNTLLSLTTGVYNTAIGYRSTEFNTTGSYNTALGYNALQINAAGTDGCVAVGFQSLRNNDADFLTAVGYNALSANTTGTVNTALGYEALGKNTTGYDNTALGYNALANQTDAYANVAIGAGAMGASAATVATCVAVGNSALEKVTGACNVAVGSSALKALTTGLDNVGIGTGAGLYRTTGDGNIAIGVYSQARYLLPTIATTGSGNTSIGQYSLAYLTSGGFNTVIGDTAGYKVTSGSHNIFLGHYSGGAASDSVTGNYNTGIGTSSLLNITSGLNNIAIGASSMSATTTADENVVIGKSAFNSGIDASNNVAIGANSMYYATSTPGISSTQNTAVGYYSLRGSTTAGNNDGIYNTAIGANALYSNSLGDYLTAVGHGAGYGNTTGDSNTYIGRKAGYLNATGSGNIFLGTTAGYNETGSNKGYIENSPADSNNALQFMNFATDKLTINGTLNVTKLPVTTGKDTNVVIQAGILYKQLATAGTQSYWSSNGWRYGYEVPDGFDNNFDTAVVMGYSNTAKTKGSYIMTGSGSSPFYQNDFIVKQFDTASTISQGHKLMSLSVGQEGIGASSVKIEPDSVIITTDNFRVNGAALATGTVTSIATTSPLTGGTITTTGTIAIQSDTLAAWRDKMNKGEDAFGWGDHGTEGYLTASTWVGTATSDLNMDGYDIAADTVAANAYMLAIPASDHLVKGTTIRYKAHENVAIGDVCYINADWEAQIGDADAIATAQVTLIAAESISANANGLFLIEGVIRDDTWNWVPGKIYLTVTGTTGNTLSQTAPTGTDDVVRIVGWALSADAMMFKVDQTDIELN